MACYFGTWAILMHMDISLQMNRRLGQPAINIYTDKDSGKPKGDATLSYEEPFCAKAAVEHFDGMVLIVCACARVCVCVRVCVRVLKFVNFFPF